jgi:hypothetical protein
MLYIPQAINARGGQTPVALSYQLARRRRTTTLGILEHFRHFLPIYPMMLNSLGKKWKFLCYKLINILWEKQYDTSKCNY